MFRGRLQRACRELARHGPLEFSVGQYNILAGYLGNNTEPWFLHGLDLSEDRRARIFRRHAKKKPNGAYAYSGWPRYAEGILTPEEIKKVEAVHRTYFAWPKRKGRLVDKISDMDCDILSLVECDHYEDHFRPALAELGYDSLWRKRPRANSHDGCCIAWRRPFELLATESVDFCNGVCPLQGSIKDRTAVMALLQSEGEMVCVVSTHLHRNPEDPSQDMLRARQVGQIFRALVDFTSRHGALEAPVILAGDLNCSSFGRLRGVANTLALLNREVILHPFTFDTADVPTGNTSVTACRNLRLDAIVYQTRRLELLKVEEWSKSSPCRMPNQSQPSDHSPIVAHFRSRSNLHWMREMAKEWFSCLSGKEVQVPLSQKQLESAFWVFDPDGTGSISGCSLRKTLASLDLAVPEELPPVLSRDSFVAMYLEAVKVAGLPGLEDLQEAFHLLDRDRDGHMDLTELLQAFELCAPTEVPQHDVQELFHAIDQNRDGLIDLEEMLQFLATTWRDSPRWQPRHSLPLEVCTEPKEDWKLL
ncbi:unnamed protein product, partial [Effrenium voratum]